jgi:hydrogenase-4 component E
MNVDFYDLVYLLLLLTGILALIENRIRRVVYLIAIQSFLLVFPCFQVHSIADYHSWAVVFLILLFKVFLTPLTMIWTIKNQRMSENTSPRFGFLTTMFLFLIGFSFALLIVDNLRKLPEAVDKIEVIYVFLMIYVGVMGFILRKHWLMLMAGFVMFENGIFLLTLILQEGLPIGIEIGAFMDSLLVIVSAIALQIRGVQLKHGVFEE